MEDSTIGQDNSTPSTLHAARLEAGAACLDAALSLYLPRGLAPTCCCDPEHIGVGKKHARECTGRSWGKTPLHKWKHFQTTRPTAAEVQALWTSYPIGNVGCVLGQASGLVRIDVDGAEGEALLQEWSGGDLPPTWTFRSSAQGRGLLYAWPKEMPCKSTTQAEPGEHRELRLQANGAQTILPPSRHASGWRYTWDPGCSPTECELSPAPAWLRARLQVTPRARAPQQQQGKAEAAPLQAAVGQALAAIENSGDGVDYDTWLKVGMALHSLETASAWELWDGWSQQSAKYSQGKQEASWRSFDPSGTVQIDWLFALARSQGWHETRPHPFVAPDGEQGTGQQAPSLRVTTMEAVARQPVEWLWWPYIPLGMLCIVDGDPGIGKSLLMTQLAASLSRGYPLPDQHGALTLPSGGPADTLLLSVEDSLPHTLKPRLEEAGADCTRIHVVTGWTDAHGQEQAFTLAQMPLLAACLQQSQPRLCVIDPIQSVLGPKVDMHRDNQVRPLLDGLKLLAERHHCALVLIRHPSKPGQGVGKVIHRGIGSVGFIATARTALFCEQHPTDPAKVLLAQSKSNIGPLGRTQRFTKHEGQFAWCGVSRLSAEVLGGSGRGPEPYAYLEAVCWLEQRLEGNLAWPSKDLHLEAEEEGIGKKTLFVASKRLGIVKKQESDYWTWRLPPLPLLQFTTGVTGVSGSTGVTGLTGQSDSVTGEEPSPPPHTPDGSVGSVGSVRPVDPVVIDERGRRRRKKEAPPQDAFEEGIL